MYKRLNWLSRLMAMKKNVNPHRSRIFSDKKWLIPFFASLLTSIILVLAGIFMVNSRTFDNKDVAQFDGMQVTNAEESRNEPPRFAYLISGSIGDSHRMMRVLQAVYHPRNHYVLHIDFEAPPRERLNLIISVKNDPTFRQVENVHVVEKSSLVTYRGPTMIACFLQAIAILLKESSKWDWFINLSASDYPLMPQDDLLHVFTNLSRSLNFIEHSMMVQGSWKVEHRARPIIVDPSIYMSIKSDLAETTYRRSLPTAFKLYSGSAWVVATRSFVEYCVLGWDNLPRMVLMYLTNFLSSSESYFQTVICNSEEFRNTAIDHDLHYISWYISPSQHPRVLSMKDFDKMVESGAPFARKFAENDPVLDKIDRELLGRSNRFSAGAWCIADSSNGADPCSLRANYSNFEPGPGAARLQDLMDKIFSDESLTKRCSPK